MKVVSVNNSVDLILAIRCTEQKAAKSFVEKGIIKFGTPQSWVVYEETHKKGRGDVLRAFLPVAIHSI